MVILKRFIETAKMRHDFGDQIQVRYRHTDGEDYDTWVSGEEARQRLKTAEREKKIKGFPWKSILNVGKTLPEKGKAEAKRQLWERLGDALDDVAGGNVIGDSWVDAVRGRTSPADPYSAEKQTWQTHLQDPTFRAQILELAWLNLSGSFPEDPTPTEPDDWVGGE
ncbi:MAG: hypothetical protein KA314_09975 [Chloroflexi bacterium]|nr:hypothetical protein [Chloroflexota bacterium]MBP8056159.1 hypothetical protein [Chloroflexota bacterium]